MTRPGEKLRYAVLFALFTVWAIPAFAQFETRSSSSVLYAPLSVAVADFNHDGKLDVAAVAAGANGRVAVLLGRGDGTFKPAVYYTVGTAADHVAAADFNRDGNVDLAVADSLDHNVTVLLGNGDGTFQSPTTISLNGEPFLVTVGDFNGDHIPDLAAVEQFGCSCISVMLGNGDGTFQAPIDTTPAVPPAAIGLGDFNRDGKLDVATIGGANGQLTILLGNGDGTFTTGASYAVGAQPNYVAVGDLTGNGILDIVVTDGVGSQIAVFLGNGDGAFRAGATYPANSGAPQLADLNGDGKLDLALLTLSQPFPSDVATVMLGNGNGTFQQPTNYQKFREATFIAVGDFNNDRKPDLVVADYLGNAVGVLLNTGVVSFSPTTPLKFPGQPVGTTSNPKTVTLTNTGTVALSISSMSVSGPFQMASGTTCGTSVAPGGNCAISVTFHPVVKGLKHGLVSISDSASIKPQAIELSGTGQ